MIRRAIKIEADSVLRFAEPVDFVEIDGVVLAISASTGNWLVLEEGQRAWLGELRDGTTIGDTLERAKECKSERPLRSLIAQITARQFAGIGAPPRLLLDNPKDGIHVYLTNACNLSCTHCYMHSGKALRNELSASEWIEVLTEFVQLGGKTVTLSGGEITTKPGWIDILRHAHILGLKTIVLTNGTLWKASDIDAAATLIDEIQVSIDGPNEASNARVRGASHFQPAVETALSFAGRGVRTSIAMTPTFDNLDDFASQIRVFAESLFARCQRALFIKIGSGLIAGRHGPAPDELDQERYRAVARAASDQIYDQSEVRNFSLGHSPNHGFSNCGFGGLALAADGGAFPCNRVDEVDSEGNLRKEGLSALLNRVTELQKLTSVDNVEPCRECEIRYVCGGGCRIEEFSFKGRVRTNGLRAEDKASPLEGRQYRQVSCNRELKESLYRKMVAATRYQYALDAW